MDVIIDNKELEKLYITGKSRKLRLPEQIIIKFFSTVQRIRSSLNIYELWADKGLNFEKLRGSGNIYSMRLSGKYRLEMKVEWKDEKLTVGKFYILEISNHYGD